MALTELEKPCWEAWCDKCEEGSNPDGGTFHHDSKETAVDELKSMDWALVIDEDKVTAVYCFSCVDDMSMSEKQERGIEPSDEDDEGDEDEDDEEYDEDEEEVAEENHAAP